MFNKIIKKIQSLLGFDKTKSKKSYSQCGEDLIIEFLIDFLKLKNFSYLDIGAHHPFYLSNTALFYQKGFSGVCIEPDPELFKVIKRKRPRDICLNIGIGPDGNEKLADFYHMDVPTLNTFSQEDAYRYEKENGHKIKKITQIPLWGINKILKNYVSKPLGLISLDVEGLDLEILKGFDFQTSRPALFCIETLSYSIKKEPHKSEELIEFMKGKNYLVYADTYINTIFVDKTLWEKHFAEVKR